jgi:acetyl-CoA carboxylase biotin carboxylase subunit
VPRQRSSGGPDGAEGGQQEGGPVFEKVLIANRGEIALRIIRTAREMGIATVAVHSDADRGSPHVAQADEAVRLGPAPSRDSYLRGDLIIREALRLGVQAIHPGYGFLAENAAFARHCADAGLVFVGPPPAVIEAMGSKTAARQAMIQAGVPVVPGTEEAIDDPAAALELARAIGFPVMLKAAAGGGGKGMRLVAAAADFLPALEAARREAEGAFGDSAVYLEKFVEEPHHIEVQVLADSHGSVLHLGERECSIQRRHQKVVEESPSPFVTPELRRLLCATAVQAARAVAYVNAGTIEFLVDKDRRPYFLEMNTRLQVEHPVTEWVTGLDLVREQFRVAAGLPLGRSQEEILFHGHAIECRVCAEDPRQGFLPDTGCLTLHLAPAGPGVRLDSGVEAGSEVGVHYDPLLAKLSVWAGDRPAAIARMHRALGEYRLHGVAHNLDFCRWVMEHAVFQGGDTSTPFIAAHWRPETLEEAVPAGERLAAELAGLLAREAEREGGCGADRAGGAGEIPDSPWRWQHRREP